MSLNIIRELYKVIKDRCLNPIPGSYTVKLFRGGIDLISRKIGEEAIEVIIASKNGNKVNVVNEVADLMYHLIVLLVYMNIPFEEVLRELERRRKKSKSSRN